MPDLPTGTVTFLFTDIEGSTILWEQHSDAARSALVRHDALVEQIVAECGGVVVRPRGEGDSRFAVFARPSDAVTAAATLQQALYAEPWLIPAPLRVRMALHTGEADVRAGDYYGSAVNRCARLRAVAHGGQTLVSQTTHALVCDNLPPHFTLRDLGEHRLKDLVRSEHIFQLDVPDLPTTFPPLKSLELHPNNLPLQPTPFIGREQELEDVRLRLAQRDVRLLTLTGPGGTGKTRLALQVAAELLDDFRDGVWVVELAPVGDPVLVPSTIAAALGIKETAGQPVLASLTAFVRDKQLLLVLDNFEQVVTAADVVADLLGAAAHLKILVTSRVVLGVYGEHDLLVPPLALPDLKRLPRLEQLTQYEAVRLFVERAQAAKVDFQVTNQNAPAVAEICHRLDGLPLAIELAAVRVRLLPPQVLLQRLSSRLVVLTGGARTLPARQQTLRQAIAWSYDLLDAPEQTLFRRLGVFVGGCTLEAAETVCGPGAVGTEGQAPAAAALVAPPLLPSVLDGLQSLLDHSLLRQVERLNGEPRFTMLETIREYALEQLAASGEAVLLQQRHADYYVGMAREADGYLWSQEQAAWLDRLELEHDNIRAAVGFYWGAGTSRAAWIGPAGDDKVGVRAVRALTAFWYRHGHVSEGRAWLERALARTPEGARTAARAAALNGSGVGALLEGDPATARARQQESIAIWRELDDKSSLGRALFALANVEVNQGNEQAALPILEECRQVLREAGDSAFLALTLIHIGGVALAQGDYATARSRYEEGLAIRRDRGDTWTRAQLLNNLGEVARCEGDYARAGRLYEESLTMFQAMATTGDIARSLHNLGYVAHAQGDADRAAARFTESLRLFQESGQRRGLAEFLAGMAAVAAGRAADGGEMQRAARLLGAAEAQFQAISAAMWPADRLEHARTRAAVRAALSDEAYAAAWAEGRAMTLEQAVAYAVEETATFP